MRHRLFFWLLQVLFACWSLVAVARELEWRVLDVDARLDDEGRLHVSERHEMVFTGDWNGGERRFRVGDDQSLVLQSIARLDSDGSWVPLAEGSLGRFDRYHWSPREHTLRWRVRQDSDSDFDHTVFVHRIDYVLSGALESKGRKRWTLDHDFAFRERPGKIEQFRLKLVLGGSWQSDKRSPLGLERGPLAPGRSVRVKLPLRYTGTQLHDPPSAWARLAVDVQTEVVDFLAALRRGLTADARLWVAALFSTLLGGLAHAVFRRARERGHLEPLRLDADIDAAWIEEHILPHAPEVVGAAYHRRIGSAEVMAVLARLEREGKLTSRVESDQLELQLCIPRGAFVGDERELIEKLFVAGDHTSSAMIRSHYRDFDPAAVLRRSLSSKVDRVLGATLGDPEDSPYLVGLVALVAGGALLASSAVIVQHWLPSWESAGVVLLIVLAIGLALGAVRARRFRERSEPPMPEAPFLVRWFVVFGAVVVALAMLAPYLAPLDLVLHFGGAFALALLVVWSGWPKESAAGSALCKRIAEARRYFQAQLRTPHPRLDDAWYPYMIALGLRPELDSWLAAFGSEPQRKEPEESSSPSGGSSMAFRSVHSTSPGDAAEPTRWTGGGGRFGGAGASGSWGSAAATLAAGVSTSSSSSSSSPWPSSSSKSGSASTSTSRSGGGSGGGW